MKERFDRGYYLFSLIELLVVIAIVVILFSLLFPFLQQAKRRARGSLCTSNLKQLALAAHSYGDDHQNIFINYSNRLNLGYGVEWVGLPCLSCRIFPQRAFPCYLS